MALAYNPTLDLLEGPQPLYGVSNIEVHRSTSTTYGERAKIWASFKVKDARGAAHQIYLRGWSANTALDLLEPCKGASDVDAVVLMYVERVLDVRCK